MRNLLRRSCRAMVLLCPFVYVMREPGFVKGHETVSMVVVPVMAGITHVFANFV